MAPATTLLALLSLLSGITTAQKCTGQTCVIAQLAGSTPEPFDFVKTPAPKGGNAQGDVCIQDYYKKFGMKGAPDNYVNPNRQPGAAGSSGGLGGILSGLLGGALGKRQSCKPYTLLFAKGTLEGGAMGMTMGPQIQNALNRADPGKWAFQGVQYNNDLNGIYCIGMPGGFECVKQLEALARSCPSTKIVLGGFSQGSMVARICVAQSAEAVRKRVSAIVTIGDPFQGAPVKGFPDSNIKVFCSSSDGVCTGNLQITLGHMSYMADSTTTQAVNFIRQRVAA